MPNSGDGGSHPTTPDPVQETFQTSENEPAPPLGLEEHQPLEQPEVTVLIEPEGLLSDPQEKDSSSQVPCSTFHGSEGLLSGQEKMNLEGVLEIEKELIKPIAKGYDPLSIAFKANKFHWTLLQQSQFFVHSELGGSQKKSKIVVCQLVRRTSGWKESICFNIAF